MADGSDRCSERKMGRATASSSSTHRTAPASVSASAPSTTPTGSMVGPMNAHQRIISAMLRFATWFCIILLAVLSLLPAADMVRSRLPGRLEHFIAYAGSANNHRWRLRGPIR